jgi:hypothetical protein
MQSSVRRVFIALLACGSCHDGDAGTGGPRAPGLDGSAAKSASDAAVSSSLSPAVIASFEGTYVLESFTVNPNACDEEGPSETTAHAPTFVLVGGPSKAPPYLGLAACGDQQECAEKISAIRAGGGFSSDYGGFLTEQVTDDLLRDDSLHLGSYAAGRCTNRHVIESELVRTGDRVRLEIRSISIEDAPSKGYDCDLGERAEQLKQGHACSSLQVITGKKTGSL